MPHAHPSGTVAASGSQRFLALAASLQERAVLADQQGDTQARQALYREAVYLGIPLSCLDPNAPGTTELPRG